MKLSFVAIVKNEALNLARCLTSAKPYVNELIVVDTGSTDETIANAMEYGAKINHFEWCDDFAAARNYACSLLCLFSRLWGLDPNVGCRRRIRGFTKRLDGKASKKQL